MELKSSVYHTSKLFSDIINSKVLSKTGSKFKKAKNKMNLNRLNYNINI